MAKPSADVLYTALASERGVVWKILDGARPDEHRTRFYEIRQELEDPDLDDVSIQVSRVRVGEKMFPGKDLWLVKRTTNDAAQGGIPTGTQDREPTQGDL